MEKMIPSIMKYRTRLWIIMSIMIKEWCSFILNKNRFTTVKYAIRSNISISACILISTQLKENVKENY